jgi:hypothetical protein
MRLVQDHDMYHDVYHKAHLYYIRDWIVAYGFESPLSVLRVLAMSPKVPHLKFRETHESTMV